MSAPRDPPFLERRSYRRRRLSDAARLLPILGTILFMLPLLWAAGPGGTTARSGLYLFGSWFVLILVAAGLARPLTRAAEAARDDRDATR
ncbi:hypothetical protein [Palleronia sp.]|uniref:hypothetical protein n=1 Tax=Palleronia sp. TaxID=1940284 RepID=UPI0035C82757